MFGLIFRFLGKGVFIVLCIIAMCTGALTFASGEDEDPPQRVKVEIQHFTFLGQHYTLQIVSIDPDQIQVDWRMLRAGVASSIDLFQQAPTHSRMEDIEVIAARDFYARDVIIRSQKWVIAQHQRRGGAIEGDAANAYIERALSQPPDPYGSLVPDLERPQRRADDYFKRRSRIVTLTKGTHVSSSGFVSTIKIVDSSPSRVYGSMLADPVSSFGGGRERAGSLRMSNTDRIIEIENLATSEGRPDYFEHIWRSIVRFDLLGLGNNSDNVLIEIKCIESLMPLYLGMGFRFYGIEGDFYRMRMNARNLQRNVEMFFRGEMNNPKYVSDRTLRRQAAILRARERRVSMSNAETGKAYSLGDAFFSSYIAVVNRTMLGGSIEQYQADHLPSNERELETVKRGGGRCAFF